jgi:tRNA-splicing endonuclease subunit Sen15
MSRSLAALVMSNLEQQHSWTSLSVHYSTNGRPVVSGLPPARAYIHPDEQAEILKAEHDSGRPIEQSPEQEWVLPTHWAEKWSLAKFAAVFDTLDPAPTISNGLVEQETSVGYKWHGKNRQKRLLLATLHDDSTVVYYIMHDGIVKPRQN